MVLLVQLAHLGQKDLLDHLESREEMAFLVNRANRVPMGNLGTLDLEEALASQGLLVPMALKAAEENVRTAPRQEHRQVIGNMCDRGIQEARLRFSIVF